MSLRKSTVAVLTVAGLVAFAAAGFAAYPEKPIKIVNYVAPGGLMDVTSRKFVSIAKKYTNATFVVENTEGAGGLVAIGAVLEQPADGYTVFATTTSAVDKVLSAKKSEKDLIWGFEYVAMLVRDPECIIGAAKGPLDTFPKIVEDAKAKTAAKGAQLWSGPAAGGNDHLLAIKVWNNVGMKAKWIPYKSGPEAMMGTLSGQSVAYVGNPSDMAGRDGYKIFAICAAKRLPQFPDAPTFAELGYKGLEDEVMWRGFAMKKGCPEESYKWWEDLNKKVAADPDWKGFFEKDGVQVVDWGRDKFNAAVKNDIADAKAGLKAAGIIK